MTRYGTPETVQFCRLCTMSNQRPSSVVEWQSDGTRKPHLTLNADGVCAACEYAEIMRTEIDWEARDKELRELCRSARSWRGNHDCIVPGSGGKDSTYAAHILRERYGMHPLLVTWAPHMLTDVGRRNLERWAELGDHMLVTPRRSVHRKLTRLAFLNLCHPFQPFIAGQRTIGPRISQDTGIPLVFYGENQALYSGPVADNFDPRMPTRLYASTSTLDYDDGMTLSGVHERDLIDEHGLSEADMTFYRPVEMRGTVTSTHVYYLSYFLKWNAQEVWYYAQQNCGMEPNDERTEGSYSKYASFDDKIDPLHYYTTLAKFGMGRATYDSSTEIRNGQITREEGVALVRKYDHELPRRYLAECLEYMGIDEATFHATVDAARPEHLWEKREDGWRLRSPVWEAA